VVEEDPFDDANEVFPSFILPFGSYFVGTESKCWHEPFVTATDRFQNVRESKRKDDDEPHPSVEPTGRAAANVTRDREPCRRRER